MAYFVVQVRSGKEIEVKEMLKAALHRTGDSMVKAIYAMETFTEIVRNEIDMCDLSALKTEDISDHLYVKRIQADLSNLRAACDSLKVYEDANSLKLLNSYKENIRELSTELREARKGTRKISSVLSGYILVELNVNFHYFPDNIWHLVKSIPNVAGIPSKYNIPQEEVDAFFTQVDVTPEVEMQLDELLSNEEIKDMKNELLHEANKAMGTVEEGQLLESIDSLETTLNESVTKVKATVDPSNPIKSLVERCKALVRRKRQSVILPSTLFLGLYNEIEIQNLFPATNSDDFLHRLKDWIDRHSSEVKME
ncbi:hypothetical protein M3152_11155 [Sporosarcina luteola]|uniref:transcription termination/antitermination NusG family protein n=1 Tax=Sporosarcina luteola TaxID=582850 RepID=UPI00203CCC60|nr:transcription termination/antitermination NusG family protein [Sporosarcina luteola]MCM3638284.1 hypothetical protein [Sporosarcina luteola]